MKKRISRLAIFGAFLMALSCTIKITAFHLGLPIVAQWVNVIMNALIVLGCYDLGRIVGLSRSHAMLCGTAMFGYVFYGVVLAVLPSTSDKTLSIDVLLFFILTLIVSLWFFISLLLNNLKKTQENIDRLEKELNAE